MENINLYYVWLSISFYHNDSKAKIIADNFPNLEDFYNLKQDEMLKLNFLSLNQVKMLKSKTLDDAQKVLEDCERLDIDLLYYYDTDFPRQFESLDNSPVVLYYKGNISFLNEQLIISIVGTRDANPYSKKITSIISADLAKAGAIVVSGGAIGIDEYAHRGAIHGKGRTILIAGCGVDFNYPKENKDLRESILENNGAIISELPPGIEPEGKYFPVRNRLIAAISNGVCVTHMPIRSGASITADYIVKQGKELFCVPPWDITSNDCMGIMKFIRDGAKVISGANDILEEFSTGFNQYNSHKMLKEYLITKSYNGQELATVNKKNKKPPKVKEVEKIDNKEFDLDEYKLKFEEYYENFDEFEIKIFDVLTDKAEMLEEIMLKSCVPITKSLSILTEFEIKGIVLSHSGRRYSFNTI